MLARLIVNRIERRILVGIICTIATYLALGWVLLNEAGRMENQQLAFKARSIEQGAKLYLDDCSICHGIDGLGQVGIAPALNNPQLFGYNFFPEISQQIDNLEQERTRLAREQVDLTTELFNSNTTDKRKRAIYIRLREIDERSNSIPSEIAVLNKRRVADVQSAVTKDYDPARYNRLLNVAWTGALDSFILGAIREGRPVSRSYWPRPMPAFGSPGASFSPPLRSDQLENITDYIMNWDKGKQWTLNDLFAVRQFALEPTSRIEIVRDPFYDLANRNIDQVMLLLTLAHGDATRGNDLYHGKAKTAAGAGSTLPCFGCHQQTADSTGPMTNGTFTRVTTTRLSDPALAGYTPEHYLVESILLPGNYVVPNFNNLMPPNLGDKMEIQDLADLVAYLETMK